MAAGVSRWRGKEEENSNTRAPARERARKHTHIHTCTHTHARMHAHTQSHTSVAGYRCMPRRAAEAMGLLRDHAPGLAAYTRTKTEGESSSSNSSSSSGRIRRSSTRAVAVTDIGVAAMRRAACGRGARPPFLHRTPARAAVPVLGVPVVALLVPCHLDAVAAGRCARARTAPSAIVSALYSAR